MDCSSTNWVTRVYETFFSSIGIHNDDSAHVITLEMFNRSLYVPGFCLISEREAKEEHISLPRQGNVCIEAHFKKPLPEPVMCILYAEFPEYVEIENSKNVTVESVIFRWILLTKHVNYFQEVYSIDLLLDHISKSHYNRNQPRQKLHTWFALGSCLLFRLWFRWIFWFI